MDRDEDAADDRPVFAHPEVQDVHSGGVDRNIRGRRLGLRLRGFLGLAATDPDDGRDRPEGADGAPVEARSGVAGAATGTGDGFLAQDPLPYGPNG
jgi:hypothetical protein